MESGNRHEIMNEEELIKVAGGEIMGGAEAIQPQPSIPCIPSPEMLEEDLLKMEGAIPDTVCPTGFDILIGKLKPPTES